MRQGRDLLLRTVTIWLLLEVIAASQVQTNQETLLWTWLRALGHPFRASATWLQDLTGDLSWGLGDTNRLVSRVRVLEEELDATRARVILLEETISALRETQRFPLAVQELDSSTVVGRCLYRNLLRGRLEVSAGFGEGVRYDTPAVSADGLVGRVVRIGSHRCWIETITHPAAAVAVSSLDGTVTGLAVGTGKDLQVQFIPSQTQLLRGTDLISSGADGIYPPGVPVCRVTSIRQTDDAFLEVYAVAATDFDRLRMVMLLPDWNQDRPSGKNR
jgi:cell shape-determining protein MreC